MEGVGALKFVEVHIQRKKYIHNGYSILKSKNINMKTMINK